MSEISSDIQLHEYLLFFIIVITVLMWIIAASSK
jgi:hypothetical protein